MTNNNISVVIATLGGGSLKETIQSLNSSSIIPREILICIPEDCELNIKHLNYPNIKILKTKVRGQVAQRAEGFKTAMYPFVLQMDDDIILDPRCLENLLEIVSSGKNIAAGPKLFDRVTNKYHSFLIPTKICLRWFDKLFFFVANGKNGYVPGKISKSGINFGVPENFNMSYDLDWLCGGCIMHRNENLIRFDFYPLSGKAYSEDLFHSKLLRDKNVILVQSEKAKCYVDFSSSKSGGILNGISISLRMLESMKIYAQSINGNLFRLHLVYCLFFVRIVLLKLFCNSSKIETMKSTNFDF